MTRHRIAIACLLLLVAARRAPAGSARALELDEMIDLSQEIVRGEVLDSSSRWEGKVIVTDTRVRVDEPLKGSPPAEITLTQLGGTAVHPRLGVPINMASSAFTPLQSGESVVLFVGRRNGRRELVGAQQGKLVLRSEAAKPPAVTVGPKRLRVFSEAGGETIGAGGMTVDELRDRIRARAGTEHR